MLKKSKVKIKKKAKTKGGDKKPKMRQTFIPGTEPKSIAAIDKLADSYVDIRDKRMELTAEEIEASAELLDEMVKHDLTEYKYDGKIVKVVAGDKKVKVKSTASKVDVE